MVATGKDGAGISIRMTSGASKWSTDTLQEAVEMVQFETMSLCAASRKYGIPKCVSMQSIMNGLAINHCICGS